MNLSIRKKRNAVEKHVERVAESNDEDTDAERVDESNDEEMDAETDESNDEEIDVESDADDEMVRIPKRHIPLKIDDGGKRVKDIEYLNSAVDEEFLKRKHGAGANYGGFFPSQHINCQYCDRDTLVMSQQKKLNSTHLKIFLIFFDPL